MLDILLYFLTLSWILNSQMKCGFSDKIDCLVHKEKSPHVLLLQYWILVHFLANTTSRFNSNPGSWNLQLIDTNFP